MAIIGWLDGNWRWNLPVHQPVEGNDFIPWGWAFKEAALPTFGHGPAPTVCGVCSYDVTTGKPKSMVLWENCRAMNEKYHSKDKVLNDTEEDPPRPRPKRAQGNVPVHAHHLIEGRKF